LGKCFLFIIPHFLKQHCFEGSRASPFVLQIGTECMRGPKYFQNLNLLLKRDVVQYSATRYHEPTIFWTSLLTDALCRCVWWFFKKLKWLILENNECLWYSVSFWEKLQLELSQCLRKLYRIKPRVKRKCMSGLIISKEVKCMLKTNHIVANLPPAELMKTFKKFARLSLQIVVGTSTKFLK
jgi:hypothetical protein